MHPFLRSVWDEPRPAGPPPRGWRDWALVGVLGPLAVLEAVQRPEVPWLVRLTVVALLPTLLWRRSAPLPVFAVALGVSGLVTLVVGAGRPQSYTVAYVLILVYALVRWGSGREIAIGAAIAAGNVTLSVVIGQLSRADAVGGFVVLFAAAALGAAIRYRARARVRELDQAKLLERERLARDLHDTVAHHVSAMAIRAQAGIATAASHPDAAVDALRVIEAEASRALAEMRAMVRVLRRDQPADLAPNPGIADLRGLARGPGLTDLARPALADFAGPATVDLGEPDRGPGIADLGDLAGPARSGPAVDVEISGDLDGLPPSVGTAIYRLAQESVTNARRHARHATRVEVRVAADSTSVRLQVSDDGDAAPAAPRGYGLTGMIERADLLGGTLDAGPSAGRGWTVTAVLPRSGVPA
ncbi:two-component sensor histidine kinase [Longispora fulva]|uniref:histidine kinase n=1 Tax=Longispora fulva TaxID=619741 RepID=A0A8J7GDV5_9ACTN|nr:histidine kinase [Longispora fulva]MBG6134692.1 signal transduction histidine kinase [Longispora fulva]GIG61900.1 two-component sensor histidine kinase [Longispora fulva]